MCTNAEFRNFEIGENKTEEGSGTFLDGATVTRLVLSHFLETRGAMSAQSLGTQGPLFQEVEVERLDRGCWTVTAGLAASGSSRGEALRTHLCQAFRQGLAWLCLSASPPDSELHFVLCPSPEPSPGPPGPPPSSSACAMPCPGSTGSSAPAADYLVFTLGLWAPEVKDLAFDSPPCPSK